MTVKDGSIVYPATSVSELISRLQETFQGDEAVVLRVGGAYGPLVHVEPLIHLDWAGGPAAGLVAEQDFSEQTS
ncbi:hypothetical protein F4Y93_00430 [Candidatus Poribacteria bacterium]|nr:hypothetical protein [Candidatus Poribacteria bacterium]